MHPLEFWWQLDARRPKEAPQYGSLSETDVEELHDLLERGSFDD